MNNKLLLTSILLSFAGLSHAKDVQSDSAKVTNAVEKNKRYIISFKNLQRGKNLLKSKGLKVDLELSSIGSVAARIPAQALKGLSKNPNINYIEEDQKRYPMSLTETEMAIRRHTAT